MHSGRRQLVSNTRVNVVSFRVAMSSGDRLISIVVPAHNEAEGIGQFYASLTKVLESENYPYEILFVDDGSTDDTTNTIRHLITDNPRVRLLVLSRNFGKEIALTAGLHGAKGNAIITLDADGQHPVELIPQFVRQWEEGAKVVVGVRTLNQKEGFVKHYGSELFYVLANRILGLSLIKGSTDFRLIDETVQKEFKRLNERNRITRGLIDWLGYDRAYIQFVANARMAGEASYSFQKLVKLAIDGIISHSTSPLRIPAYLGAFFTPLSVLLLLAMGIDSLTGDPLHLHITGSAYGIVLVVFLAGILLISQGVIGIYLSDIHTEAKARPLFLIDKEASSNL